MSEEEDEDFEDLDEDPLEDPFKVDEKNEWLQEVEDGDEDSPENEP